MIVFRFHRQFRSIQQILDDLNHFFYCCTFATAHVVDLAALSLLDENIDGAADIIDMDKISHCIEGLQRDFGYFILLESHYAADERRDKEVLILIWTDHVE